MLQVPTKAMVEQGMPATMQISIDDQVRMIHLRPYDMRSRDFQLMLHDGVSLQQIPSPPSLTMRGSIAGSRDAGVAASLTEDGTLHAMIELDGETWAVEPVLATDRVVDDYLVYRARDVAALPFQCQSIGTPVPVTESVTRRNAPLIAQIAIEADAQYVNTLGGTTSAYNDILQVMNGVDLMYQRDVMIMYSITQIILNTPSYGTSDPSTLLSSMSSRWNTTYAGVPRDIAHLFTGVDLNGTTIGIAYIGAVCTSLQYGVSQSQFGGSAPERIALTAHELGHNWNATHCSGSGCNIMCASLGGCSGILTGFAASEAQQIMSYSDSVRGCLDSVGAGFDSDGADATFAQLDTDPRPDLVLMSIDDPAGANGFFVGIGWNVDSTGFTSQWSSHATSGFGNDNEGGGVAFAQLDSNPRLDMVLMAVDAPTGPNTFVYKVMFNVNTNLVPTRVSSTKSIPGIGQVGEGAAIAFANIDANSTPALVLMTYDAPTGANSVHYKVAYNIDANGDWVGLVGQVITVAGFGNTGDGAGIRAGYFNANDRIDLVVMVYDRGTSGSNDIRYRFLYDLQQSGAGIGAPSSQSASVILPGHGTVGQGAGVAVEDLDGNGRAEVLMAVLDSPSGVNQFRWTMLGDLGVRHPIFGQFGTSCRPGMVHTASGSGYVGQVANLNLSGAPSIRPVFCAVGLSRTLWSPYPLPLDLAIVGAPACFAYTNVVDNRTTVTGPLGTASLSYQLPNTPSAIGITLYSQFYVEDLPLNAAGLAASNATSITIGG